MCVIDKCTCPGFIPVNGICHDCRQFVDNTRSLGSIVIYSYLLFRSWTNHIDCDRHFPVSSIVETRRVSVVLNKMLLVTFSTNEQPFFVWKELKLSAGSRSSRFDCTCDIRMLFAFSSAEFGSEHCASSEEGSSNKVTRLFGCFSWQLRDTFMIPLGTFWWSLSF